MAAYQRDALAMAAQGWQVASVTESRPRAGCMRIFLLGIFALVFPPKPHLVVTYTQQLAGPIGQTGLLTGSTLPSSVPLPVGIADSEPPYEAYRYDGRILAGLVVAYILSWILIGLDSGHTSPGVAGNIGTGLFLVVFFAVAVLDWRGFRTLNGVVNWQRLTGGKRFWMVCAYIFLFPLMLGIYLVQAAREYFYARQPDVAEAESVAVAVAVTSGAAPASATATGVPGGADTGDQTTISALESEHDTL